MACFELVCLLVLLCLSLLDVSAKPEFVAIQNRKRIAVKIFALRIDNRSVEPEYIGQCCPGLKRKPTINLIGARCSRTAHAKSRFHSRNHSAKFFLDDSAGFTKDISVEDRFRGAVWGQFVGDAAALGTHWIYDLAELQQLYPRGVSGFEAPKEGHYHFGKKPGDQTHYGDGALIFLESIAKEDRFDARAFGRSFVENFAPGVYSGYIDIATRGTLENYQVFAESHAVETFDFQQGGDDDQLATPHAWRAWSRDIGTTQNSCSWPKKPPGSVKIIRAQSPT